MRIETQRLRWIGWDARNDTAIILIAPDPGDPIVWYNRRHLRAVPLGLIEMWAEHQLALGQRFAVQTALEIETLRV